MSAICAVTPDLLKLDAAAEVERIENRIREIVFQQLKRKGAVLGVSGGIDSTVTAFLCARALGKERTKIIFMPEKDSSSDSLRLGRQVGEALGVEAFTEDIAPILEACRCYERRDAAIRSVVPEYGEGYKSKIVLPNLIDDDRYAVFSVVVQSPSGEMKKVRLTAKAYLGILAATNFKQRVRKMLEYHYADLFAFAVAGTPNRLEYDQAFFVKNGDGSADFKPIAHLFKTQVYQLAEYLGVPREIQDRPPTTDTYSLEQSQDEFYFALPHAQMDLCLYAKNQGMSPAEIADAVGLDEQQVERVYAMIDSKRKATYYLQAEPQLIEPIDEV